MPNFPKPLGLLLAAGACALAATRLPAYTAGPPPAHTGAFGEPNCRACHFDYDLNESDITIRLDSLPAVYQPGQSYALRLVVQHAELQRGGFQLTARFEDGQQAGSFVLLDTALVKLSGAHGITYVTHTAAGADQRNGDTITWRFKWTAPERASAIVFSTAVNVANRDDSEFGDRIFIRSFPVEAPTQ